MGSLKRQRLCEPTTLMSLGDDMLAEILRRLPSQPSLARAAFACPRLLSVASSSVANHFISPAALLGYFISVNGGDIPSFHRALLRSNPAIVRRGDFLLADFEEYDWRLMDCRNGLLLLASSRSLVVFDPVSSSRLSIPHYLSNGFGRSASVHCFLLCCGGVTASFRVVCLQGTGRGGVRAHVYSSCTGEWCSHSPAPKGIKPPHKSYEYQPMHAGRRIYWRTRQETLTSLHVGSMVFSHQALPDNLCYSSLLSYSLGDMEDGTTCLVAVSTKKRFHCRMQVWFLKEEEGSSSWEMQWSVHASEWYLLRHVPRMVRICDVTAGVLLICMGYEKFGIRYRAFRLKDTDTFRKDNTKRQPLCIADFLTSPGLVHPYFMSWPRLSLKAIGSTKKDCTSEQEAAAASNKKKQV
ncbi:unnamed protein product [Alopecurus aequalis]